MPEPSLDRLMKDVRRVLSHPFWIQDLDVDRLYERLHDDDDGSHEGRIQVSVGQEGDIWVTTDKHQGPSLRFRTFQGGGQSEKVRNALMILAWAIKLDNEERPQE